MRYSEHRLIKVLIPFSQTLPPHFRSKGAFLRRVNAGSSQQHRTVNSSSIGSNVAFDNDIVNSVSTVDNINKVGSGLFKRDDNGKMPNVVAAIASKTGASKDERNTFGGKVTSP